MKRLADLLTRRNRRSRRSTRPASSRQIDTLESRQLLTSLTAAETPDLIARTAAFQIDQHYGFEGIAQGWSNWGGQNEVWLQSESDAWFYLTPDGALFDWQDEADTAVGTLVAELGPQFHQQPSLLFDAVPPISPMGGREFLPQPIPSFDLMQARHLDQEYGFDRVSWGWSNWAGMDEIWLESKDQEWFYLTPAGELYHWSDDGSAAAHIADLGDEYYVNPSLLFDPRPAVARYRAPDVQPLPVVRPHEMLLYNLEQQYEFESHPESWTNWGGRNEKWIESRDGNWFYLTPDGELFDWNDEAGELDGTRVAHVGRRVYDNPDLLLQPKMPEVSVRPMTSTPTPVVDERGAALYALDQQLKLTGTAEGWTNWGGRNEIWFLSETDDWYFLTPEGDLYRWNDRSGGADGERIARPGSAVYDNPALLFDAAVPGVQITSKATPALPAVPLQEYLPWQLDREYEFTGIADGWTNWGGLNEVWIESATDGWFYLTPEGELYDWAEHGTGATGSLVATLTGDIYQQPQRLIESREPGVSWINPVLNRDRLVSSGQVASWELDRQFDFTRVADSWTNWGGLDEVWLENSLGDWFYLTPDGGLYDWDDSTTGVTGTLLGNVGADIYASPASLVNASTATLPGDGWLTPGIAGLGAANGRGISGGADFGSLGLPQWDIGSLGLPWLVGTLGWPDWDTGSLGLPEWDTGSLGLPEWDTGSLGLSEWDTGSLGLPQWDIGSLGLPEWDIGSLGLPQWDIGSLGLPEWDTGSMGLPDRDIGALGLPDWSVWTNPFAGLDLSGTSWLGDGIGYTDPFDTSGTGIFSGDDFWNSIGADYPLSGETYRIGTTDWFGNNTTDYYDWTGSYTGSTSSWSLGFDDNAPQGGYGGGYGNLWDMLDSWGGSSGSWSYDDDAGWMSGSNSYGGSSWNNWGFGDVWGGSSSLQSWSDWNPFEGVDLFGDSSDSFWSSIGSGYESYDESSVGYASPRIGFNDDAPRRGVSGGSSSSWNWLFGNW